MTPSGTVNEYSFIIYPCGQVVDTIDMAIWIDFLILRLFMQDKRQLWLDVCRWPPETEGPSTVHSRYSVTYDECLLSVAAKPAFRVVTMD